MADTLKRFGEYRLGERLSTSAVADVFVADGNDGTGPTVVLKIFHTVAAEELPALSGRAQQIATVDCARLLLPTSWGVVERRVFMARPAVPAVDLGRLLKEVKQRQAAVSLELALTMVVDLLVALRALHSVRSAGAATLYHGDLCAAHVLVDHEGNTCLLGAESPRRSAGPSTRLDIAGAAALLYEILNAGASRRLPAAAQGQQAVLRAQFEPLFLQGLGLSAEAAGMSAADFLTAIKVQIDLAGIAPQRDQLAEWGRSFGLLRPDPAQIKSAPSPFDASAVPAPAPIDFGAITTPDAHKQPLGPQMRTEPFLSPFVAPSSDEKTEVSGPPGAAAPSPAARASTPTETTGAPIFDAAPTEPSPTASAPATLPPAAPAARPPVAPRTLPASASVAPSAAPPVRPPVPPRTAPPQATPPNAPLQTHAPASQPPSSVVLDRSSMRPPPPMVAPGNGVALDASGSLVPAARPAFAPADTVPSSSMPPAPVSRPPARVATTAFEPDKRRLGEILIAMRATTQAMIDQALEIKRQRGGKLGELLLQSGAISDQDLAVALGRQAGVPTVTADKLVTLRVADPLLAALPEVYASAKRVLPVAFDPAQKCVTLLVVDPSDATAITEARVLVAAQHAEVWVAPRSALEETIRRLYASRGQEIAGDAGDLLLLCTPNQTLAGSLKVRLVAEGFAVRHVTDGQVARDALEGGGVRGIVTELALPKVDGYNLILTTRSRDEYRDIPIFVFSSRADDYHMSKALELGADDFLPMPLNVDFLVSKLRRSIVRKPAAAAPATMPLPQQGGVGGSLKEMPLPEIVQTLELGRKTASVDIAFGDGVGGTIVFVDGQVVAATAAGKSGEDAFFLLATPREGTFQIHYGVAEGARNINNSTTFLLLEAMRRIDEAR